MIIVMNVKDFKNPKKFYKMRETHLINGSDNEEVTKIKEADANQTAAFQPSKTLLKQELVGFSKSDRKAKEKKFLKSSVITTELAKAIAMQLDDIDSNVYILLDKKVYKSFADKFIERFNKLVDLNEEDGEILFIKYNDYDKAIALYKSKLKKELGNLDDEASKASAAKVNAIDAKMDDLEFELRSPDREDAMKYVLKDAKPSKSVRKKMAKFMEKVKKVITVGDSMVT